MQPIEIIETNPKFKEMDREWLDILRDMGITKIFPKKSNIQIQETNPTWMITLQSVVDDGEG